MQPLVEMRSISKSFFGVTVLHNVDFSIYSGEVMALCGENGAGKSTLMKILAAVYSNEKGEIFLEGKKVNTGHATTLDMQKMGVSMIHQELNLMEYLTVAQNIFLTREPKSMSGLIDYKKMNADAKELLTMLGQNDINPRQKIYELKIAQKQMIEIAKAISFNVNVLIMDEPTSMLTSKETDVLFQLTRELAGQGIGIIYISHRLREIKEVCDRVTVLRDGELVKVTDVASVTEQEIANLMVGREVSSSLASNFTGDEDAVKIEVRNVTDHYLKDLSFKARRGEIVGFSGLVGAGRTELMEFIFGVRKAEKGMILIDGKEVVTKAPKDAIRNGIGFATEDRQGTGLFLRRNVTENINLIDQVKNKGFWNYVIKRRNNTMRMVDRLNIKCQSHNQFVSNLSGGNQQKIVLAKWLLVESDILILDEPTRGIDVGAREEVYNIIREQANEGKTILIVSSDLTEVLSICHRIIIMHEGAIKAELLADQRTEENIMYYATDASSAS